MVTCWWNDNGIQGRVPTIPAVQEQSLAISGFGIFVESNPILNVHHSPVLRHPKAPVNIPRTPSLEFGQGPEGLPNSDGRCSDDLGEDVSKECQMFAAFPAVLYWWKLDTKMSWLQSSDSSRLHKTPELKTLVTLQDHLQAISRDLAMQLLCQDGQDLYLAMDATERTSERRVEARQGARELRLPGQSLTRS